MPTIQLSDRLYEEVAQHASDEGFASVDAFIADTLEHRLHDLSDEDMDSFFTPEIIAQLDAAVAEARTSKCLTSAEVEAHFIEKREAWLKSQAK